MPAVAGLDHFGHKLNADRIYYVSYQARFHFQLASIPHNVVTIVTLNIM